MLSVTLRFESIYIFNLRVDMEYKISQLVQLTGVPKSTILYYIKEGLLLEAKKIKSNVHMYNDEHIEQIKYIKYMKEEMKCSISQLKSMIEKKNQSISSSNTMLIPLLETLSGVDSKTKVYTREEILILTGIDEKQLNTLLNEEIIVLTKDNYFTEKEISLITLVSSFEELGLSYEILIKYIKHAKEMAKIEIQMSKELCDLRDDENFSKLWKITFETLFNAKSYLFNRQTHKEFVHLLKDEML